jgi:hypothetical protein
MTNMAEIVKIKIKLGKKEIELTAAEAKQLQEELNQMFGDSQKIVIDWHKIEPKEKDKDDYWPWIPSNPWHPPTWEPEHPYKPIEIWCKVDEKT